MHPTIRQFEERNRDMNRAISGDKHIHDITHEWFLASSQLEYSYHFSWLGRPIIQFPQDIVAIQELIWKIKPDLVIEPVIAQCGSLFLSASILALLD
jgi:cephalosporin hydroxylase